VSTYSLYPIESVLYAADCLNSATLGAVNLGTGVALGLGLTVALAVGLAITLGLGVGFGDAIYFFLPIFFMAVFLTIFLPLFLLSIFAAAIPFAVYGNDIFPTLGIIVLLSLPR